MPAGGRDANFHRELQERPWRTSLRPLDVVQPEGPSWHVEGNQVTWEGWHFHVVRGAAWAVVFRCNGAGARLFCALCVCSPAQRGGGAAAH